MLPSWLIALITSCGTLGMGLGALRNSWIAARLGLVQAGQSRAQTDQLEATTITTLFDCINRLQAASEQQQQRLDRMQEEIGSLRRYVANVRRSAGAIGIAVSTRGVLSVAPGDPILVVDDDPDIRAMLSTFLEDEGYTVAAAGSVDQALALVADAPPSCVIVDLWLGGGQSVAHLVTELRKLAAPQHPAPVIVCTADKSARARALVTSLDADALIQKPFDLSEVLISVRMAMKKREGVTA